jgi:glyoxylase-like metal-dependent hydrolase (beta-lactamase superfamily II)
VNDINQVLVLRYAHRESTRGGHFIGPVDHPDEAMPMSYYVWLIRGSCGVILIDTGFSETTARRFGRTYVSSPADMLAALDIDPAEIRTVILTHLHYDHAGCITDFAAANLVLQDAEVRQWTGRRARPSVVGSGIAHLVLADDVSEVCRANLSGQVTWVDGDAVVAPGVSVHHVGGHTEGMQVVRVHTTVGYVVLASDSTHFYDNFRLRRPYSVVDDVAAATMAFDRLSALASSDDLVVPGHDPAVLERFPALSDGRLAGHVVAIGDAGQ